MADETVLHHTLHELEPVMNDDNTEVKVPVTPCLQNVEYENNAICIPGGMSFEDISLQAAQLQISDPNVVASLSNDSISLDPSCTVNIASDTSNLEEVSRLISHFRRLPTDLFINQMLSDFCTDEVELERVRSLLFESLRVNEDFPFGLSCSLKRRVRTRNGERLATKLAKDIHALLTVMEGADYSDIKDIVNSGNPRGRSKSVNSQQLQSTSNHTQSCCSCESQYKLLTDKISSMEAELLLTKQRQIAIETARTGEFKMIKNCAIKNTAELKDLFSDVISGLNDITKCIKSYPTNILSNLPSQITETRSQLLSVSETVISLQTYITKLCEFVKYKPVRNESPSSVEPTNVCESNKNTVSPPVYLTSEIHKNVQSVPNTPVSCNHLNRVEADRGALGIEQMTISGSVKPSPPPVNTEPNSNSDYSSAISLVPISVASALEGEANMSKSQTEGDGTFGNVAIPVVGHVGRKATSKTDSSVNIPENVRSYRDAVVNGTNRRKKRKQMFREADQRDVYQIPVRVARNASPARSDVSDFSLSAHVKRRRRTKRFYVGGFLPSVSEKDIKLYVSERGPKVSKVTIFRNKKYNTATIRLNVHDNADCLHLDNPFFWPEGITCRPWVTHNQYKRGLTHNDNYNDNYHNGYRYDHEHDEEQYHEYSRSYNRYSALECDVD